jgi:kinesin family protein 11
VFTYDAAFGPATTQTDVYQSVAAPVVDEALRGMNCCILAYGQTGTGKTYTMLGDMTEGGLDEGHAGLIPRAVQAIFAKKLVVDDDCLAEFAQSQITVSFMEIYNEQVCASGCFAVALAVLVQ